VGWLTVRTPTTLLKATSLLPTGGQGVVLQPIDLSGRPVGAPTRTHLMFAPQDGVAAAPPR
jgi:hypothetical protein